MYMLRSEGQPKQKESDNVGDDISLLSCACQLTHQFFYMHDATIYKDQSVEQYEQFPCVLTNQTTIPDVY